MLDFIKVFVMGWIVYATLCLFVSTGYKVFNQHYKINASILMLYRGIGTALITLPFILLNPMQENIQFYYYAVLLGFVIAYLDNAFQRGIAKFGAGPISRVSSLYILASLVIWWFVDPNSFVVLINNKEKLIGVIISVLVVVTALFFIKEDKLSRRIIKYCIGIYISCILIDIYAKLMFMVSDGSSSAVFSYMFFSSLTVGVVNLIYIGKTDGINKELYKKVLDKKTLTAGLMAIFFIFTAMYTRNSAIILVDNPAYVSTFVSMSPVVITLYNKLVNFEDKTNKFAGLLIVVGCIMLSVFAK